MLKKKGSSVKELVLDNIAFEDFRETVGIVGGTGDLGSALAVRLSRKYQVMMGSREKAKAESRIGQILSEKAFPNEIGKNLIAGTNSDAVSSSTVVILTVPMETAAETIRSVQGDFHKGQLLISAVASIEKVGHEFIPTERNRSIAETIKEQLTSQIEIATAFQTVPSSPLYNEIKFHSDVPVAADKKETFYRVACLVNSIEYLKAFFAGSLKLSSSLEGLTALLLNIQIRDKIRNPTIRIQTASESDS